MDKFITLYHTTDRDSAQRMHVNGIGMSAVECQTWYDRVLEYLNVPLEALLQNQELFREDGQIMDFRKGAGFWPLFTQAYGLDRITCGYNVGTPRTLVERLVRRAARYAGQPYTQFQDLVKTLAGELHGRAVVRVKIPVDWVTGREVFGTHNEHHVPIHIDPRYIDDVVIVK